MSNQADTAWLRADTSDAARACDQPAGGFMRELAHELGNIAFPLRMIIELQNRSAPLSGDELQDILQNQVDALQAITRRLQRIGRCLSAGMEPDMADVPPGDVVKDAVELQQSAARAGQHAVSVDCPEPDELSIQGDRELLVQALAELIGNAIRFTPSGGSIDVALRANGNNVEFVVSDTGPGVSREVLPRMFEPFVTGSERMTFDAGVIGCGLALVRQVMAVHQGAVELRRTSSAGSEFAMVVPIHRSAVR
jgi:signal transduction histidine kinase